MIEFRFTSEQLATLWSTSSSLNQLKQSMSPLELSTEFTLTDEQFRSLLHIASPSTTARKSNVSTNILQVPSALTDQLAAMHERLKSSMQAHAQIVNAVSDAMLKHNRIESAVNLVHQLSLHTIDDVSNKEVETIPSFVLDLLKVDPITENIYRSIKQGEITDFITNDIVTRTIVDEIQAGQLSFNQIQKIQTQFLTPKLMGKYFSEQLVRSVAISQRKSNPTVSLNMCSMHTKVYHLYKLSNRFVHPSLS